ncbi:hypothetical protein [Haloglycomyces albus]|uniref:hypothetical protein n=1 Tax=Haloglycomyces albus TaxID=526067 RepID=UPI00046CD6FF|nr:hypothetical protein [Haloglycomyces albus]
MKKRILYPLGALLVPMILSSCTSSEADDDNWYSIDDLTELRVEQWNQEEELIAQCMNEEGFDYTPLPAPAPDGAMPGGMASASDGPLEIDFTVDRARRDGFGIVESLVESAGEDEPASDPNKEHVDSLSDTEYLAWEEAMDGDDGCKEQASRTMSEETGSKTEKAFSTIETFTDYVFNDPRFADINSDWSACMADDGWETTNIDEFVYGLSDQLREELSAVEGDAEATTTVIDEFTEYEREAAVATAKCWEGVSDTYDELIADAKAAAQGD